MKIYIAAPWGDREQAREIGEQLQASGHTITHEWWDYEGELDYPIIPEQFRFYADHAKADAHGVIAADAFVLLNTKISEGKSTELGIALTLNKPCFIIEGGEIRNLFLTLPTLTWCSDGDALEVALREFEKERNKQ